MAIRSQRRYETPNETVVTEEVSPAITTEDRYVEDADAGFDPFRILWLFVSVAGLVVTAFLGARLLLLMAGADPNGGFADFVYSLTDPLVAPFNGIADNQPVEGDGFFDAATAIAMAVYVVATALVMFTLGALSAALPRHRETTSRRTYVRR
jgi:uncharacterized protein YggT (Ycf19 family)